MTTSKSIQRKHADFQDRYRRSSNFRSVAKSEKLSLNEDGNLSIKKAKENE